MLRFFIILSIFIVQVGHTQSLFEQRIRKITPRKRSIFFGSGVFHSSHKSGRAQLTNIRQHYSKQSGHERLVFEFLGGSIPPFYGFISKKERKLYLDFSNSFLSQMVRPSGLSKYISNIDIFPFKKEILSIEVMLKKELSFDIFYLKKPGRLVIDIKEG